ncbi:MAG: sulfite exporter TauE/SafE family protein [Leptolyngbya sp. IPPAS B-1204]
MTFVGYVMLEFLLICSLGFFGSFGHCAGMCGPITAAFALSVGQADATSKSRAVLFHLLLNLGRVLSYVLTGAAIGALGSVLMAGGQLAGVGSGLRQVMTLVTGSLLIWFGLTQIRPGWLPKVPLLHLLTQPELHQRLSKTMVQISLTRHWGTPFLLGMLWGLIPCGFLYTAQIKAAETGHLWRGAATMLAFGLGTVPTMVGVGFSTALVSADRRSQLFRIGGWVTLTIGIVTLLRTGDMMVDYTGYGALISLMLALIARPISRLWAAPLRYRRALGVGAFVLALLHTLHMVEHSWQWNLEALWFMLPQHQWGMAAGMATLLLMTPAALTSFDRAQRWLGAYWRYLHLLAVPGLILAAAHCILVGSHYLGAWQLNQWNQMAVVLLSLTVAVVLLIRCRWVWSLLGVEKLYGPPNPKHSK